jgi:predicted ATP-grasp superfamily ATP-dependent carboligase
LKDAKMPDTLLILGASVRAAAQSARRCGLEPFGVDLFADVDLRRIASALRVDDYPSGLANAAATAPDGPWMFTGGLENHPGLIDRIARRRPLLGNTGRALRAVRNPFRVARVLKAADLPCPALARHPSKASRDGTWLLKPRRGTGGAGITAHDSLANPPTSARGKCYLQKRIAGLPCSGVYVGTGGKSVLLGVTRQLVGTPWTGASRFGYAGSIGPLVLDPHVHGQFDRLGAALADHFALEGLFGVDAVLQNATAWPVEVNPRFPASVEVLERAFGFSATGLHVTACREGKLPPRAAKSSTRQYGKAILYARSEVVVTEAFGRWTDAETPQAGWPGVADIPAVGTRIGSGQPVMTVLGKATDEPAVEALLQERLQHGERLLEKR